jgi:adenosine deaminase
VPGITETRKAELHCHVDGLIDDRMLEALHRTDAAFPVSPAQLKAVYPVTSLEDWGERYGKLIYPVVHNRADTLLQVLKHHLGNLADQRVIYAEIMLSSINMQCEDLQEQMRLYRQFCEIAKGGGDHRIQVEFLIAFGRGSAREKYEALAERILEAYRQGLICGVAVAGNETSTFLGPFKDIFEAFKKAGLGVEIHAGEWGGPEYVWDALENGCADRIGHGLAIFKDPLLLKHIEENRIHVEFCHPGPFLCSMNSEFRLLERAFHFTERDYDMIFENSMESAFARKRKKIDSADRGAG